MNALRATRPAAVGDGGKHLPAEDVAHAGGWKDTRALEFSYQHADPATVLKVVEGGGGT